jgi:hypothetical protein
MKKLPRSRKRIESEGKRAPSTHLAAQEERRRRREAKAFDLVARRRGEISNAADVSEDTKRIVAQLSHFELALYIAGKQQREHPCDL